MHAWSITGLIRGKNTLATYRFVLDRFVLERFARRFGKRKIAEITSEGVILSGRFHGTGQSKHPAHLVFSPACLLQPRD